MEGEKEGTGRFLIGSQNQEEEEAGPGGPHLPPLAVTNSPVYCHGKPPAVAMYLSWEGRVPPFANIVVAPPHNTQQ